MIFLKSSFRKGAMETRYQIIPSTIPMMTRNRSWWMMSPLLPDEMIAVAASMRFIFYGFGVCGFGAGTPGTVFGGVKIVGVGAPLLMTAFTSFSVVPGGIVKAVISFLRVELICHHDHPSARIATMPAWTYWTASFCVQTPFFTRNVARIIRP